MHWSQQEFLRTALRPSATVKKNRSAQSITNSAGSRTGAATSCIRNKRKSSRQGGITPPFFYTRRPRVQMRSCQSFEEEPIDHWCNFCIAPSIETQAHGTSPHRRTYGFASREPAAQEAQHRQLAAPAYRRATPRFYCDCR